MNRDKNIHELRALANGKGCSDAFARLLKQHNCLYLLAKNPLSRQTAHLSLITNQLAIKQRFATCSEVFKQIKNVPYALIKGAALSERIYKNPAWRLSGDIDLLTTPEGAETIKKILLNCGFVQGYVENGKLTPYSRRELIYQQTFTHQMASFVKETDSELCPFVNVDVNRSILWGESKQTVDMASFLQNTENFSLYDIQCHRLIPVYELISLCMHHYKDWNSIYLLADGGISLAHFCDIYYFMKHIQPDVDALANACRDYDVMEYVYFCLYHTNQIFDDEIFTPYLSALRTETGDMILCSCGLDEDECRPLDGGISAYLFDDHFHELFCAALTDKDREKIEINRKFM